MHSAELAKLTSIPHLPPPASDPFVTFQSTSPTAFSAFSPDPNATPMTNRSPRSAEGTRCVCNLSDTDGGMMIQCESCTKWLHTRCVGIQECTIPPVYVCIFCTGATPVARGGRIRAPSFQSVQQAQGWPQASPLSHKSTWRQ